jgi:hypothetical protein
MKKVAQTSAIAAVGLALFCSPFAVAQNIGAQSQNRQQQAAPAPVPAPQATTQAVGGQDKRDQTVPRSETGTEQATPSPLPANKATPGAVERQGR